MYGLSYVKNMSKVLEYPRIYLNAVRLAEPQII